MPIFEAIYRSNGTEETVTVNDIEKHPNFNHVKNNLFCTYKGCSARLLYVPKGKVRAHFKTWPKNDHIPDCIDYFERVTALKKPKTLATSTMELSDKHIKNVLKNLKRKRRGNFNLGKPKPNNKKRQIPRVTPLSEEELTLNVVPTTGSDADLASGEGNIKEPSVRNRTLINLTDDDVGFARSVEGYIHTVKVDDKRAVLELKDGGHSFKVYFEENFFNDAPVSFLGYFKTLKLLIDKNQTYLFSGVGEIVRRNKIFGMIINKSNHFQIDYQYFAVFILNESAK
jgi:hypothetical protein